MNYKERADAELAREAAERQAAQAKELQVQQAENARKAEELAKNTREAARIMRDLDSLGIAGMLSEINRDIWKNRGKINTDEFKTKEGVVLMREFTLNADVPSVKQITRSIYAEAFGTYEYMSVGYDVSTQTTVGWHNRFVRTEVHGYKTSVSPSCLTVRYNAEPSDARVSVSLKDPNFSLPVSMSNPQEAGWNKDSSKERYTSPNGTSISRIETGDRKGGVQLTFGFQNFDINLVRDFIDQKLLTDSIYRTQHPIEPDFERAQSEISRISREIGKVIRKNEEPDPTPFLKRFSRPYTEHSVIDK